MSPLDQYFEAQEEPMKGCLLAIKDCMLRYDDLEVENALFFLREGNARLHVDSKKDRATLSGIWLGPKSSTSSVAKGRSKEDQSLLHECRGRSRHQDPL
jgi:hypothetical protein